MVYHATDEDRAFVLGAVITGMPHKRIAQTLGISDNTLAAHFADYLQWGHEIALARVAKTAYSMAVSGDYPAMTMFYLKTQGRWRETARLELDISVRDRALEIARELGLPESDAEETVAEIEKRMKDRAL